VISFPSLDLGGPMRIEAKVGWFFSFSSLSFSALGVGELRFLVPVLVTTEMIFVTLSFLFG